MNRYLEFNFQASFSSVSIHQICVSPHFYLFYVGVISLVKLENNAIFLIVYSHF